MLTANPSIILIVDDQPTNLKMLFSFLLESGYKVLVAKTGESALQKLQNISPDLILLDVMMPEPDGLETCRRLKASAETKDIPVIFMTALSEPMDKIKGFHVGAVDYITKPFQQEEVLARIENQLQIRRLQRQLEEQNRQLQQSQLLLTGVLNSSLDGVAAFAAIRDNQGQIIDFKWLLLNPTGETMMAGTASELVGQSLLETRPGFRNIGLFEKYVRVVETGTPLDTEVYYAHETIQAWFQVVAVQLNDGCAVTLRDITERKQMEERNRALLDAIPDMMFRQRVDGTYLDVQAEEGSLLTSPEIFIGTNLRDRPIPDAVKQGIFEHLQAAVETGELQTYEYELPLRDGVHAYEARFVKSGVDEAIRIVRDVTERKQAELALRESEARFRGIFESASIAIGLTTAEGTVIAANPTYEVFLGYTKAEIQGLNFAEITHPDDLAVDLALTQEIITGVRDSFQLEKRYIRKDGQLFWGRLSVSAIRNQQGEIQFTIAIVEDINDSKLREFVLKESERRFRATFNDSFQFTELLNPNGTVIEANQTALDFGGVKPTDVTGLPFWETCWWREEEREMQRWEDGEMGRTLHLHRCPETLSSKQEQLREAIQRAASGQFVRYEVDVTGVGDCVLTLDFSIKPIRDETGKVVLLISEGRDITEYKQTREALLMAQKRLEYLLFSSPSIIYTSQTIEPYGATFVSENVTTAFGYKPREFIEDASFWIRHVHPDDTKRILADLQQLFEQGHHEHEYRFLHKDGTYRWVYDALKLVRDEQGNCLEIVGSWLDITDRKQIEAAWIESQHWLQAITEANPNILYVYDLIDQQNVYCNRQLWSILGYQTQEVQQMGSAVLQTLMHPDDFVTSCEHFKKFETAKEGEILEVEYRMRHKDGEWRWLISRETLFTRTADGKPKQVLGAAADISDRKRAEEALHKSQARLQKLAANVPGMLYEFVGHTDNSYRLDYVSSGCRDIYELEPEQLVENIGLVFEPIHPDDLKSLYEAIEISAETLERFAWEGRLILRSGKRKWIQGASRPEQQANGDILWHGLLIDISDRKQAEFEIKAATAALEQQIQRVLLHERITQDIRSSLDPKQVFQTAANQIGEAFGVHRCLIHTYIDHPIPQIPLVAEYQQAGLESLLNLEIPVVGNPHVQLMLAQDQAIISDDVYIDPLLETASSLCQQLGLKSMLAVRTSYQGKPNGAIGIHQYDSYRHWTDEEISLLESVAAQMGIAIAQANLLEQETQRRQELAAQNQALEKAKLAAEAANRAKSLFLSKMSHELRTPLNAILGFSQVMARNEFLTTEQREYLEIINRSGEHLLELINDILSMAKIEAGQVTLNENRFDLYRLLDSLEQMLRLKAAAKGLLLIFERANDVAQYVQTDESKLRQVLLNLLGNAIKFTQKGSVTLRVRGGSREENHSTPRSLIFEVSDTGSGIAPEELDTLFEPFVQTQTGRQSMEGTGLGLPISQQFVRLMGGTLTVRSVVNQGASFTFDIQIGLASSADEKPISSKRRVLGLAPNQPSYRILVVEDAAVNRKLLVKILEPLGFEVRTATNGQEAIVLWESWSPHLIWMDIIMPIMDGFEATQQIKRTPKGQDTIIIALTADAFEEQRDAILRAGCNDFLPKPFQREVLLEKIACYLGVRYIYDDQQSATSVVQTYPSGEASPNRQNILKQSLTRDALAVMSAPWITELHQAALYADDEQMNQLIEQIPSEHSSLRQALRELLNNFRLEQLITLTEPTAHE